jgi:hypothetical protein
MSFCPEGDRLAINSGHYETAEREASSACAV